MEFNFFTPGQLLYPETDNGDTTIKHVDLKFSTRTHLFVAKLYIN